MKTQQFEIGHRFLTRGKHPRLCEIIDIHKTYNSKDELIQIEYLAVHDFAGQKVVSKHVTAGVTIGTEILNSKKLAECMMGRDAECNHHKCPVTEKDIENGKYCTLPLNDYRQ